MLETHLRGLQGSRERPVSWSWLPERLQSSLWPLSPCSTRSLLPCVGCRTCSPLPCYHQVCEPLVGRDPASTVHSPRPWRCTGPGQPAVAEDVCTGRSHEATSRGGRQPSSGIVAAAGVVNQADGQRILLPGYFTTPGSHHTHSLQASLVGRGCGHAGGGVRAGDRVSSFSLAHRLSVRVFPGISWGAFQKYRCQPLSPSAARDPQIPCVGPQNRHLSEVLVQCSSPRAVRAEPRASHWAVVLATAPPWPYSFCLVLLTHDYCPPQELSRSRRDPIPQASRQVSILRDDTTLFPHGLPCSLLSNPRPTRIHVLVLAALPSEVSTPNPSLASPVPPLICPPHDGQSDL